jgi:PAS domain S-box-containing protein
VYAPDGDVNWQRWTDRALFDKMGNLYQYQSIGLDITESKRAEQSLRISEERFREMAELMPQTVFETDAAGKLTFANRKAFENFGYSQQDFDSGLNSLNMLAPEDHQRAAENIIRIMGGEEIGLNEYTALRKDGSSFPIMTHSAAIVRDGKTLGVRGVIIDITDRKKAEEARNRLETQLHQAQKLETIGTLAGGIAHDFNNLMATILGNTSLMLYDIDSTHPHYEPLKNIERQINRGAELTTQLLGYARKGKYYVKPVNLNQIVEESAAAFGRTRKEISIHYELADDLLAVEADHGQIQQVLLNLFVNAADAMAHGGSLVLKTSSATHDDIKSKQYHPAAGDYLRLTVSDTGVGMDKKVRQRIFDPFFSTKETGKGTGLGLASVYGIIKNHGGYIDVQSQPGQGSQFSIFLPASDKEVLNITEPAPEIMKGSGTILIVDDEKIVLDVSARILKKLGYTVLESNNGRDAVVLYKKHQEKINLVVLDIVMPDMGGDEVYDRLKEIDPEVKILLCSGYSIDDQAREIMERGCEGFIQKPFSMKAMSDKLSEVLPKRGAGGISQHSSNARIKGDKKCKSSK